MPLPEIPGEWYEPEYEGKDTKAGIFKDRCEYFVKTYPSIQAFCREFRALLDKQKWLLFADSPDFTPEDVNISRGQRRAYDDIILMLSGWLKLLEERNGPE